MRKNSSPLKHQQLKSAQALLDYCQTTSIRRIEWELENTTAVNGEEQSRFFYC